MARIAVLIDGVVANLIEADSVEIAEQLTGLAAVVSDLAGVGDSYDEATGEFIAPPAGEPAPEVPAEPEVAPAPKTKK